MYNSTSSRPIPPKLNYSGRSSSNWTTDPFGDSSDDSESDDGLQRDINRQSLSTLRGMHQEAENSTPIRSRSIRSSGIAMSSQIPSSSNSSVVAPRNLPPIRRQINFDDISSLSSSSDSSDSDIDSNASVNGIQPNQPVPNRNSNIAYVITYITDLVIKLDLLFNSKIKITINLLSQIDVDNIRSKTATFVDTVKNFYIHNRQRINAIQNGTELYENLQEQTNVLANDVLIATNSYAVQRKGGFLIHSHPSLKYYGDCDKKHLL